MLAYMWLSPPVGLLQCAPDVELEHNSSSRLTTAHALPALKNNRNRQLWLR